MSCQPASVFQGLKGCRYVCKPLNGLPGKCNVSGISVSLHTYYISETDLWNHGMLCRIPSDRVALFHRPLLIMGLEHHPIRPLLHGRAPSVLCTDSFEIG